ncbi:hypothetical protein GUITHDRAFT_110374 [Guillardia theta CCMP2712]|uniref:Uncharacterized protein n=1 Tax=Guillardia theta (strain CCMP2712) TaxID=905079 RepID=L1J4V9_GUITC|nr:hypothetical protein GUITHDRAFT_110374 [Guillardia theta CCMP2712]EKX43568.1 hypothetical protein GUITHDRAFT_110374 [Guillardia theta CCMP2712]|eukprot:XP_005830548.1 hypothetical protein GUITHDRAFT_110374 [Guillardia theta CCMP2712]
MSHMSGGRRAVWLLALLIMGMAMAGAGAGHDGGNEGDAQSEVRRRMQEADHAPRENPGRKESDVRIGSTVADGRKNEPLTSPVRRRSYAMRLLLLPRDVMAFLDLKAPDMPIREGCMVLKESRDPQAGRWRGISVVLVYFAFLPELLHPIENMLRFPLAVFSLWFFACRYWM